MTNQVEIAPIESTIESRPAGFWRRAGAKIVDYSVCQILSGVYFTAVVLAHSFGLTGLPLYLKLAVIPMIWILYPTLFLSNGRRTLGYRLAGIRLTDSQERALGVGRALWRSFLSYLFMVLAILLVGILAYVPVFATKRKRAVHDVLSGTRVGIVSPVKPSRLAASALGILLVGILLNLGLIRSFVAQGFYTPSESMHPTLHVRDQFMVNKLVYKLRSPRPGDVIVYKAPARATPDRKELVHVHRVVGLPGDLIEVRSDWVDGRPMGVLYRNGKPVKETYLKEKLSNWDYGPYKVPKNTVFVMGDNRNNSNDSRFWGSLDKDRIIGKAMFCYSRYKPL